MAAAQVRASAGRALAALAMMGTLFSIYLTWLEVFVIKAECLWCLASAVLMGTMLVLAEPWRTDQRETRPLTGGTE